MEKYRLIRKHHSKQFNIDFIDYEHIKSGCKITFIQGDSVDKYSFNINFRTLPSDDTGVAHILEHCIFGGSKKYPLNKIDLAILKYSLVDNQNAETSKVRTRFYASSYVKKDFKNIFDIFLDSVFNPLVIEDKNIFLREGYRVELDKNNNNVINGVVYNEMKAEEAEDVKKINRTKEKSLYPNSVYSRNSGGDPKEIINLKYEDLVKFYKDHYYPGNCLITILGNLNIEEELNYLDKEYLSKYKRKEGKITPIIKPILGERIINYYPSVNPKLNNTYTSVFFDIEPKDAVDRILWSSIVNIWCYSPKQLFLADLKEKYGNNISTHINKMGNHRFLILNLSSPNPNLYKSFMKDFFTNLKRILNKGLNKNDLITYNKQRIDNEEIIFLNNSLNPSYFEGVINSCFSYDEDPLLYLEDREDTLKTIKFIKEHDISSIIRKRLINTKYSFFTSIPSLDEVRIRDKENKIALEKVLKKYKKEDILKEMKLFKEFSNKDQSDLELKVFPKLKYTDLEFPKYEMPTKEYKYKGIEISEHNIDFKKYLFINLMFDLRSLTIEEIQYLDLYDSLIFKLDTKKSKLVKITERLYKYCYKLSHCENFFCKMHGIKSCNYYLISIRCKYKDIGELYKLIHEVLYETIVKKEDVLKFIDSEITNINNSIKYDPGSYLFSSAYKNNSESDYMHYKVFGLGYYEFINRLKEKFSIKEFNNKIKSILDKCLNINNTWISMIGNNNAVKSSLDSISLLQLSKNKYEDKLSIKLGKNRSEALIVDSQVSYNLCYFPLDYKKYHLNSKLNIIDKIVSEHLYNKLRMNGGAYGVSFVSPIIGSSTSIAITSRDPNVKNTFDTVHKIGSYLSNIKLNKDELELLKMSELSTFFTHKSIEDKCDFYDNAKKFGVTFDERIKIIEKMKKDVIDCSLSDIREYGNDLIRNMDRCIKYTIGNKDRINDAKDYFNEVKTFA